MLNSSEVMPGPRPVCGYTTARRKVKTTQPLNLQQELTYTWLHAPPSDKFEFFLLVQYWWKYQKALNRKLAITVVCFNSFLWALGVYIKEEERKLCIFQIRVSRIFVLITLETTNHYKMLLLRLFNQFCICS